MLLASVAASIALADAAAQQPAFRASTEAIYATATVVDQDGRIVTDLTQDEFEVRDNGEVRPITIFSRDRIPFALTLMFDVSGSLMDEVDLVRSAVEEFTRHFEPGDRVNIGAFAALPVVSPYFSGNSKTLLEWVGLLAVGQRGRVSSLIGVPCYVPGGKHAQLRILYPFIGTALNDALVCGINVVYADGETPRRAVMLVSDGFENKSNTLTREVIDLALERGIMLYTVGVRGRQGLESGVLKQFSEETGGGYFELKNNTDLPATFARIGEELRRQYVFGFTPAAGSGTSPRAKRRLEVNALRPGLTTRARQVYMEATPVNALPGTGALTVDAPMSGPAGPITVTRSPNASTAMSPLAQRLLDYRPGQSAILPLTRDGLWSGAGDFRRDAIVWVDGGPTADAPRRRLVVATYVLEMLQEFEGALWKPGRQASGLLEWAWTQLEKSAPLPAERGWWTAALALVERSSMADGLRHHLTQAEKRFPNDDQWLLTRAIADELELRAAPNDDGSFPISRAFASRIAERFQQAAARPSMRAEALIRWAAYDSDMGRQDAALAQLAGVGPMEDQLLRFWHALVTGRALDRANRAQEAAEAYRKALAEFPLAQSAALGLAGALVNMRQLTDAAMFVRGAVDADASIGAEDPWDFFFTPDVRRWPGAITTLRNELVR